MQTQIELKDNEAINENAMPHFITRLGNSKQNLKHRGNKYMQALESWYITEQLGKAPTQWSYA